MTSETTSSAPAPFTTLTIDQICVHPLNVRRNKEDANRTIAMEKSIERVGIILPLVVTPMPEGSEAPYGALAGGRRTRAIRKLVDAGRLPPDWPISCTIRVLTPAEIVEMSWIENHQRVDLRPYENHLAIRHAHDLGHSVEEIALNTDQSEKWVRQQLRLGNLHPEIMAAYAEEEIGSDLACAFAATEDQELQRTAFINFRSRPTYEFTAKAVRAFYKVGDQEQEKLLRFVGEPVYWAAGGRYELDLFADGPERGRVVDVALLQSLVEKQLEKSRATTRIMVRRPDLSFASALPMRAGTIEFALEIKPTRGKDAEGSYLALPEGPIVATLTIDDAGETEARFWWASRKAKREAEQRGEATPVSRMLSEGARAAQDPNSYMADTHPAGPSRAPTAVLRDEHGLSAEGLQVMRAVRQQILRAALVLDASRGGNVARDWLVWQQLRQIVVGAEPASAGGLGLAASREAEPPASAHLRAIGATALWNKAVQQVVQQPFLTRTDPVEAFSAFVAAEPHIKNLAATVVAGRALFRSANVEGCQMPVHDELLKLSGLTDATIRATALWDPSEDFLSLVPKAQRLALAAPFLDDAGRMRLARMNDDDATRAVAQILRGAESPDDRRAQEAMDWLPPVISFAAAEIPAELEEHPA